MGDDAPRPTRRELNSAVLPMLEPPEERVRKRRWPLRLLGILLVLLLIIAGVVGWAWYTLNNALDQIQRDPELVVEAPAKSTIPAADLILEAPVNILVMGSDSRDSSDEGRSDVLMIAHFTAQRDKIYLISFPRDMYVEIPNQGKNKINAAFAFGGPPLVVETMQQLTGITCDHTMVINFERFLELSQVIGGVEFYNATESSSEGFHFPEGHLNLQGEALLAYVRQRKGLPNGDLDRTERHRHVLGGMFWKLATPETLTNPAAMQTLIDSLGDYFTVDPGFTNQAMIELGTSLRIDERTDLVGLQAPISGFSRTKAGAAIDVVDTVRLAELADAIRNDVMDEYVDKYGTASGLVK
jgi:LCP family protein required for cell wall assembly